MRPPADLAQRSISAALWGASGALAQLVLQFGIQVVLARLLGPEQYGLFALAAVVVGLGSFFTFGVASGLIQKRTVTDDDVRFVNFFQCLVGGAVALAVFFLADSAAAFFQEPRVAPVIHALAAACLIQALAAISGGLLSRDLDFKTVQLAAIVSYIVGYGLVGIPLAVQGYGVDALVAAFLVQALLALALQYARRRHALGLLPWHGDATWFCRYGATASATHINNWVLAQLSRVVVGRMFPSAAVGLYALPYNLTAQLAGAVTAVQAPLFSAGSRVQDDVPRLRSLFLTMLAATALLAAPLFAGIAAAPHTLMLALYGGEWLEGAALLRPFALAMPFYIATMMGTPMLWNSGRTTHELKYQLPIVFVLALTAYLAALHSLAAVAWAVLGIFVLRFVVITGAASAALGLGLGELAAAFRPGVAVSAAVAGAVALVDGLATHITKQPQLALAADIATGFLAQVIALRLATRWYSAEVRALFEKLVARLPRPLAPFGDALLALRRQA